MNTWDVKTISIGPGLASGGALEEALHYLAKNAPALFASEVTAYGLGVVALGKSAFQMTCLDTATGKTLHGEDAIGYIASQPQLLAHLRRLGAREEMQVAMIEWVQNNSVAHALHWSISIAAPDGVTKGVKKGHVEIAWKDVLAGLDEDKGLLSLGVIADKKHAAGNTNGLQKHIAAMYEATLDANDELDPMRPATWSPALREPLVDAVIGSESAKRLKVLKEKFLSASKA